MRLISEIRTMKNIILPLSIACTVCTAFAQKVDTTRLQSGGNTVYYLYNGGNKKLIVFLHGGVNNPYFKEKREDYALEFLIEGNEDFVTRSLANGFNLLLPVTNDSLNWIEDPEYCFAAISTVVSELPTSYDEVYIAGFSDGGTGSYKLFYSHSEAYAGLFVFNGYPFHRNFAQDVDYTVGEGKTILFFGTIKDKTIPYEFLLTEYAKQKEVNPNTYLYVEQGDHSFGSYGTNAFALLFDVLSGKITNTMRTPIHGLVCNDSLIHFYEFRKEIVRKYAFGEDYFRINKEQMKKYK